MALYPPAVKRLLPLDKSKDPAIKPRVVILHVAATDATTLYNYFNGPSGGVESHFYILKNGTVEQYRDTGYQADANVMANGFAISIETQGLADGTWTAAQIDAIKALLRWCNTTHGVPLSVPKTWDGSGVGYHILFEDQWDQRHASCPGPNRIAQFKNVLVPWMASGGSGDELSAAEVQEIKDYVRALVAAGYGYTVGGIAHDSIGDVVEQTARKVAALTSPAAPTLTDADHAAIAVKVADLLAVRLKG